MSEIRQDAYTFGLRWARGASPSAASKSNMKTFAFVLMFGLLAASGRGYGGTPQLADQPQSPDAAIRRCDFESPAWKAGQQSLAALHDRINSLADDAAPGPPLKQLAGLLSTECFRFAAESPRTPEPDTALALREWWQHGGHEWLASYLELPELGSSTALTKHVVVPPDTRRTLRAGDGPAHLSSLLCALSDRTCAADTQGWRARAEAFLALHRGREQARASDWNETHGLADQFGTCEEAGAVAPEHLRYRAWRDCLESRRSRRWTLPLGRLQSPTAGWLIVSGRRGHYTFCDAIGAYHLATGAAYIAESCSGLALLEDGSVDRRATRRAARLRMVTGTLRLDNVRESAWALILLNEAEEVQAVPEFHPLPSGLTPVLASGEWQGAPPFSAGEWMSTAQTTLEWSWVPEHGPVATGSLTWPNSSNGVEEHAAGLLEVAEGTLIEGCPPSPPPPIDIVSRRIRVHRRDAIPGIDGQLVERFRTWRAAPPCDPSRTRSKTATSRRD